MPEPSQPAFGDVVGKTVLLGAAAGAVSGVLAVLFFGISAEVTSTDGLDIGTVLGVGLVYGVIAAPVGGFAGAVLGVPIGLALGSLAPVTWRRRWQSRLAAAVLSGAAVALFGTVLLIVGTSWTWTMLLAGPQLVTAVLFGAWKAPWLMRSVSEPQPEGAPRPPS
ncbi:hypothetical protein [Pseudonocardia sp. TRM90224]|uniref:hypothetical protein n=1 Tax=Pseudonocardia sp. TRM90224 TaxID=2812678 RepID=UPI001E54607E|nr:hypothetical protein [Pseudonocardia sp. TRM90224]